MYTLTQVKDELLKRYNQDIDLNILEECIHIWEIDSSDEMQNDVNTFDEASIRKLYRGIKLKNNGYNEKIISEILSKTSSNLPENGQETSVAAQEKEAKKQLVLKKIKSKLACQSNPAKAESSNVIEISTREKIQAPQQENSEAINKTQPQQPANEKLIEKMSSRVAEKVCGELLGFFKDDEFLSKLDNIGELKRDNEILSKQVKELIKVNQELEDKIFQMELKNRSFKQIWRNFYIKIFNL